MKILQVIPYFIPAYSYGGPIKVCFNISEELARNGHEVTVVTTDTLDEKNRIKNLQEKINEIQIIRFRNISNWLAKNYNGYLPTEFYFWAKKNILNFDIVYCHDFFTLQNIITAHFCKKYKVPFIVQPHGTLSPIRQEVKSYIFKKAFLRLFSGVLKNSKNIIALTENEKKEIISIDSTLENKIVIIPNGLQLKEFENIRKIDLYEKYNIPRENKIIGYIGRVQYIKGIDISLEILSGLKNKLDFTYLVIGPDEGEKEKLLKKINLLDLKKNVIFAGILKGKEKLEVIKSCDLFLFTSRSEGLPMTVLEIATLGVPQIISKNCHVPEIEKSKAGYELDLKNKADFSDRILLLLNNKTLHQDFSENSKKMVSEFFDIKETLKKIETILSI
ncbi:MAG: glycosyltransferase [Candidatus Moraniibacteriota bacterium]